MEEDISETGGATIEVDPAIEAILGIVATLARVGHTMVVVAPVVVAPMAARSMEAVTVVGRTAADMEGVMGAVDIAS